MLIYENDGLCYKETKTGKGRKMCTKSGCIHNTPECMAWFDFGVSIEEIYVYHEKLYLIGISQTSIVLFRCDMDGTNHERICEISGLKDNYSSISANSFLKTDTGVYVSVTANDASNTEVLENGVMSDAPGIARLFYIDFESEKASAIHDFEECYQCFLYFQNVSEDEIFFEFQGNTAPYEELYDLETGELKKEDTTDISYVGVYNISKDTVRKFEDRKIGDYIGYDGTNTYVAEMDDKINLTGKVISINYKTNERKEIIVDELKENKTGYSTKITLLEDGFALNTQKDDNIPGEIILFDKEWNPVQKVKNSKWYIVGEYNDIYTLRGNTASDYMGAYVYKEDIKKVNRKAVRLSGEE